MIPSPHFDILVAGEINPDLILSGDVEPSFGQVEKLVDTAALTIGSSPVIFACGAGDCFDAGIIYGVLQGWPLEKALRVGTICGALSTRKAGETSAQPMLEEIMDYLE